MGSVEYVGDEFNINGLTEIVFEANSVYPERDRDFRYVGELRLGVPHGRGIMTYADGSVYTGYFVNGKKQGYGSLCGATGTHTGNFVNDRLEGRGTYVANDGSVVYTGDFVGGLMSGTGSCIFAGGGSYTGQFLKGVQHGYGTHIWANGNVYKGEFRDGKMHGRGRLTFATGDAYEGEFAENLFHGNGTYIWRGGKTRTCNWIKGKPDW